METKFHRTKFGDQQLFFRPFDLMDDKQPTKTAVNTASQCWSSGWWFQIFFVFIHIWGNDPF